MVFPAVPQTDPDSYRRKRLPRSLRPLDEADRAVEIWLEISPFGRRNGLEAVEVEMRHVHSSTVPMPDRESGARDGPLHAERAARAANERRLS